MNPFLYKSFIIISMFLFFGGHAAHAKKMYRWVDEHGNVRYSDQVPPDQAKFRRESLNKNARVLNVLEKEKTKAQLELEKRLAILRKQQDGIIAKQKGRDKVLLSTFRNIDDMKMTLKGKMLALDGQRKVLQRNLQGIEQQLQQQQKKAAQHERDGRNIPKKLLTNITESKEQITQAIIEISRQIEKKKRFREDFEADISRFSFLTQPDTESKELSQKSAENMAENELGLFICETIEQCEKAWMAAKQFVSNYSTTEVETETDVLIMSRAPYLDTDLSLSVSKMKVDPVKKQIFLDIRCRKSSLGVELCKGTKAQKIRQSFSDYIKSDLAKGPTLNNFRN